MSKAPDIYFKGSAEIERDGENRVLFRDLELNITANEITCLLGASGVGKSTILRLIAGLDTGAKFTGDITASDQKEISSRIAYMAQGGELFPWLSVIDNVMLGAKLRGEKSDETRALNVIDKVGLSGHINKKPAKLSGGEQQRVSLARTLMEDRSIVLLDEPFSALDAKTRSEMQELAGDLLSNHTVLLVTHDPFEAARLGNCIQVMTPQGLQQVKVPDSSPVRADDDDDTLACQGRLYRLLREGS
jgi:putative hydroxymethylpyrimidine transport system ATP-binding protein